MYIVGVQVDGRRLSHGVVGGVVLVLDVAVSRWRAHYERNLRRFAAKKYGWPTAPERFCAYRVEGLDAVYCGDFIPIAQCSVDEGPVTPESMAEVRSRVGMPTLCDESRENLDSNLEGLEKP
jgi:hypothetical protein